MFQKILIANRGEIACRIARTCRRMGIAVATVHSEVDRDALHVREIAESIELGAGPASASYLVIEKIIAAARRVGADAVHPGYGFLAENPMFAAGLAAAGLVFIGPSADVLARFGDKAAAKGEARAADVPVVPGTEKPTESVEEILAAVEGMELPVLLKATAGGGGKGMRVVSSRAGLRAEVEAVMREARSAFGDPRVIVEEYLPAARHIEVQILGDGAGNVIHLLDRECSLQRRHQKVVEEAPALSLAAEMRQALFDRALRLGRATRYRGLGTVEFLVKDARAYFLEVNPRIQVEHPVTEEITGLDLVELQLRAVADGKLPITQDLVRSTGMAVEARLCAEDPANRFLPATGMIEGLRLPTGVRIDTGVDAGMEITPYYDPMIAKLIVKGGDRRDAYERLEAALAETEILGVTTNLPFLRRLAADPAIRSNDLHTGTIDALAAEFVGHTPAARGDVAIAAALWLRTQRRAASDDVWGGWLDLTGWRLGTGASSIAAMPSVRLRDDKSTHEIRFGSAPEADTILVGIGEKTWNVRLSASADAQIVASVEGCSLAIAPVVTDGHVGFSHAGRSVRFAAEAFLSGALLAPEGGGDGRVRAPMMGRIVRVDVAPGQAVAAGDRLAVMESMKMELPLSAPVGGIVSEIGCALDTTVERDQIVFVIAAARQESAT